MSSHEAINSMWVKLFNDIWDLEEKVLISDEFTDISTNDMHIIEVIGVGKNNNMSAIAKKLNITVGSLTTSMNSLVNKKYVVRNRSEKDRRVVYIQLTEKGKKAYAHHERFHQQMSAAVVDNLSESETAILIKTLQKLSDFVEGYGEDIKEGK